MLVATFRSTTTWAGKKITSEEGQFILEGHGPITPEQIMQYDEQSQLKWANDGERVRVGALVAPPPPSASEGVTDPSTAQPAAPRPQPSAPRPQPSPPRPQPGLLIATFNETTAWVGKTITYTTTYKSGVFTLQDHGPISPQDVMRYDRDGTIVWANQSLMRVEGTRAWMERLLDAPPDAMLVATFTEASGWSPRQISLKDHQYFLQGWGPISPQAVDEYHRQGVIIWSYAFQQLVDTQTKQPKWKDVAGSWIDSAERNADARRQRKAGKPKPLISGSLYVGIILAVSLLGGTFGLAFGAVGLVLSVVGGVSTALIIGGINKAYERERRR